ncbi:MAG: tRNA pseudouridine(38-40) synthase TruA [Rickettsiales bacterium]|nr:tRNA pseudouridine(38-40) synthase TruA [Rickettsiales bacterium]
MRIATTRYKIIFEYEGGNYCGLQKQSDLLNKSIEEVLENALRKFCQQSVKINCSSRTDAGVHALKQVAHFDLNKKFDCYKIIMATNNYLRGENISVIDCEIVSNNFHCRFDAKMRHYQYVIINRRAPLTLEKNRAWHLPKKLNCKAMREAAKFLIGEHDFSAFRDSECQAKSPVRTIKKILIKKNGDKITILISAKSFLHHMVRNIIGTLVWVGNSKIDVLDVKKILESHNRTKSGPNAPACGLYFLGVDY